MTAPLTPAALIALLRKEAAAEGRALFRLAADALEKSEAPIAERTAEVGRLNVAKRDAEAQRDALAKAAEPFTVGCQFYYAHDPDERVISLGRWSDEPQPRFYADTRLTVAHIRALAAAVESASPLARNEETK